MASVGLASQLHARSTELVSLIGATARGDQAALTSLYDVTSKVVFSLLVRMLGDAAAAEELLVDVYLQVWRQAKGYDSTRVGPFAWLITIARAHGIDHLDAVKQGKLPAVPFRETCGAATVSEIEETLTLTELQSLVRSALGRLTPDERQVIELSYYSGRNPGDIALELDQSPGTVKKTTRCGMIKLREMLNPVLEEI